MVRNMGVARDLGYLHVPGGLLIDLRDAEEMPPGDVVLISTGSQGEPMSALSRMAGRDHPIRIAAGDTVILASSLIPGNETSVYRVINGLTRLGARVVHKESSLVHVSGHAPAGELLYLLNLVKPRNFMPVHGEWRHLRAHARLASLTGVPDDRIVIAEDGVVVDLADGKASIVGAVDCGYVYVDGLTVGEVTESQLKDRRILGDEGFISVIMVLDSSSGKIVGGPEIHTRGSGIDDQAFRVDVLPKLEDALERAAERRGGRRARDPAALPPGHRQVGVGQLPAPADDHPGRRRGLASPRPVTYQAGAAMTPRHCRLPALRPPCRAAMTPRHCGAGPRRPAGLAVRWCSRMISAACLVISASSAWSLRTSRAPQIGELNLWWVIAVTIRNRASAELTRSSSQSARSMPSPCLSPTQERRRMKNDCPGRHGSCRADRSD